MSEWLCVAGTRRKRAADVSVYACWLQCSSALISSSLHGRIVHAIH